MAAAKRKKSVAAAAANCTFQLLICNPTAVLVVDTAA
jgi:hypothetical protein